MILITSIGHRIYVNGDLAIKATRQGTDLGRGCATVGTDGPSDSHKEGPKDRFIGREQRRPKDARYSLYSSFSSYETCKYQAWQSAVEWWRSHSGWGMPIPVANDLKKHSCSKLYECWNGFNPRCVTVCDLRLWLTLIHGSIVGRDILDSVWTNFELIIP